VKTPKASFEAEIASAAMHAVGRPALPVVKAGAPLPPIEIGPRRMAKPRGRKPDPEPFDVADVLEQVAPTIDAEGRHYPRLTNVPRTRERELELALKDQWTELASRCIQVADLCNRQQQQAAELQTARQALDDLDKSVGLLQAALTQQENETASAKEALVRAEQEMAALRVQHERETAALRKQLEVAQNDAAKSQQQARNLKTAFEERGALLASARQKIEMLAAELAVKTAEAEKLAAPIDEERRQHRAELTQQSVRYETEVARLTRLLAEREQQLDTLQGAHTRVAKRYEGLARSAEGLEAAQKTAQDHVKSQAELIQVLEALLKVERETAEGRIAEITAALENERAGRAEAERSRATMRKDIVHLLPKLVARRGGAKVDAA
jgi:chromosome segregation ATPase